MPKNITAYKDDELFYMLSKKDRKANEAFAELYSRLSARVYAYCLRYLGKKEEAQDVFQDTFVKFYQSAEQERNMTNVPAFVLRIARNLCSNYRRMNKENSTTYEEYMSPIDLNYDSGDEELLELIKKAINKLEDKYRELFILREYDGLSYQEIADITGESVANVKVRIFRAKNKLRELLAPYIKEISI